MSKENSGKIVSEDLKMGDIVIYSNDNNEIECYIVCEAIIDDEVKYNCFNLKDGIRWDDRWFSLEELHTQLLETYPDIIISRDSTVIVEID